MKTYNLKLATVTLLDKSLPGKVGTKNTYKTLREYRVAAIAARAENRQNDFQMYSREMRNIRARMKQVADSRYVFKVALKNYTKYTYDVEEFGLANPTPKELKKIIKQAIDQVIRRSRLIYRPGAKPAKIAGVFVNRLGNKEKGTVFTDAGSILKAHIQKNIKNLYEGKAPVEAKKYIGIELEFCAPITEDEFAVKLFQRGIHKFAQLKQDGSLRPREKEFGFELALLLEESNYKKSLKQVTNLLREVKAVAKDRRAGLHVHIDMRRRDKDLVYNNFVACQYALLSIVDPSRFNNEFCRVVDSRKFPTEFTGDRHERYKTINAAAYYKFKTLEIRMHEGSVDFDQIAHWTDLLVRIANYSKRLKDDVLKLDTLKRRVKLKDKLYNYVVDRSCTWQVLNNEQTRHMREHLNNLEDAAEARLMRRDQPTQRTTNRVADLLDRVAENPFNGRAQNELRAEREFRIPTPVVPDWTAGIGTLATTDGTGTLTFNTATDTGQGGAFFNITAAQVNTMINPDLQMMTPEIEEMMRAEEQALMDAANDDMIDEEPTF